MNLTQLQERLRLELRRRIERGTLSVSLLSRQTDLGQGHLSNFLSKRRGLSLQSLDRILAALHMEAEDLIPSGRSIHPANEHGPWEVPLVSSEAAMLEPTIRTSSILRMLTLPNSLLGGLRPRCNAARRQWERFVAIQMNAADIEGMQPILKSDALIVLDRHYNSFAEYRPNQANLYAVRNTYDKLVIRYADFTADRLILRTHQPEIAVEVVPLASGESANNGLVGRVAFILHQT